MSNHTLFKCGPNCDNPGRCPYCDGGLAYCTVCHGAEGSLPTSCPGRPMSQEVQDDVYACRLDFRDGAWVVVDPRKRAGVSDAG
jgi:hypothetical protein